MLYDNYGNFPLGIIQLLLLFHVIIQMILN